MSPDFAAAVCEGIRGTLEELLSQESPEKAREILLGLRERAGAAADLLCADGPNAELAERAVLRRMKAFGIDTTRLAEKEV